MMCSFHEVKQRIRSEVSVCIICIVIEGLSYCCTTCNWFVPNAPWPELVKTVLTLLLVYNSFYKTQQELKSCTQIGSLLYLIAEISNTMKHLILLWCYCVYMVIVR